MKYSITRQDIRTDHDSIFTQNNHTLQNIDYNASGGFSFSPGDHPGGKVSLGFLLDRGKEKETLVFLNRVQSLKSPQPVTSGPVNLVLSLVKLDFLHPASRASLSFLFDRGEVAAARTFGLVNLVFPRQTAFSS